MLKNLRAPKLRGSNFFSLEVHLEFLSQNGFIRTKTNIISSGPKRNKFKMHRCTLRKLHPKRENEINNSFQLNVTLKALFITFVKYLFAFA